MHIIIVTPAEQILNRTKYIQIPNETKYIVMNTAGQVPNKTRYVRKLREDCYRSSKLGTMTTVPFTGEHSSRCNQRYSR